MAKKRISLQEAPSEYQECVWLFEWAKLHPVAKEYLIKHVNEGKRSLAYGQHLKSIGLRSGLPDYQLPVPNRKWNSLWLEMKKMDGEKKKKEKNQDEWIEKLLKVGHYATYVYGWVDAVKVITDYLENRI